MERLIDYRGKTPPKSDDGVRLVTAKVIKSGFIQDDRIEFIDPEYYDSWMRRGLPVMGDTLVTTEAPLGEVAQIRTEERIALAQRVILLRPKPNHFDQNYFYHAMKGPDVQAQLNSRATGTTVLGIKQSELRQIEVACPPLPVQKRIASILGAHDDLIENNQRRIKLLEEMAQLLYREWFVHYRFPGHEDIELMDSNLGPIPEGWKVTNFGALAQQHRESCSITEVEPSTPYIGLGHMPKKSIALGEWGQVREATSTKLLFQRGDWLFGKIRPYFHKVGIAVTDGVASSDAIVMRPRREEFDALMGMVAFSDDFIAYTSQSAQGTKMPRANWDMMCKYPVSLPPHEILNRFNRVVLPMLDLVQSLVHAIRKVREARNLLLPRLISGELDVSNIEIEVPA